MIISRLVLLRMRSFSDKLCRENLENLNTHIAFIFFSENPASYGNDVEEYGRDRQATYNNIILGTNNAFACRYLRQGCRHTRIVLNTYCFIAY